ncbi:MAG: hypothetical protein Q8M74_01430, partial [Chloroflexota bacterium]|nr:hypothetical protein [Chloroflexota bacterium]
DGRLLARMDPFALAAVAGWLVVGGIHSCPAPGPDATPCPGPGPLLTDREPSPDGLMTNDVHQQSVRVWPGAVGIVPGSVVTSGPFLYRITPRCVARDQDGQDTPCFGSLVRSWEVMARYDASTVYRVVVP